MDRRWNKYWIERELVLDRMINGNALTEPLTALLNEAKERINMFVNKNSFISNFQKDIARHVVSKYSSLGGLGFSQDQVADLQEKLNKIQGQIDLNSEDDFLREIFTLPENIQKEIKNNRSLFYEGEAGNKEIDNIIFYGIRKELEICLQKRAKAIETGIDPINRNVELFNRLKRKRLQEQKQDSSPSPSPTTSQDSSSIKQDQNNQSR